MKPFNYVISRAILIETPNIDTDQIIPARFLKTTLKSGLGKYLFYNSRFDANGKIKRSMFNQEKDKESILIAGTNFGCGSSREHAVWALIDYGFRAVISSEFADIFYNNALKNGLLCAKLEDNEIKKLFDIIRKNRGTKMEINLEEQTVEIKKNKIKFHFEFDQFRKSSLLFGVDELGYILSHQDKISAYEKSI